MARTHAPSTPQWRTRPESASPGTVGELDPRRALDRAAVWFRDRETHPGIVARQLMGHGRPTDAGTAGFLIRERRRRTRMDGSLEGSLVRTAWTAWELLDLGCQHDDAPVVRTIGFVLSQQNEPGHFGEGCDPDRHVSQLCAHYLAGFFSPGPRDRLTSPLQLPMGVTVEGEERSRFAASCVALRVVLRAGEDRRAVVRRHIESLLNIPGLWDSQGGWSLDLQALALGGIMHGPYAYHDQVELCLAAVIARQAQDGSWPGGDLLLIHDVLTAIGSPTARDAVARSLPHLLALQRHDGSWEGESREERTLIALRALRFVLQLT